MVLLHPFIFNEWLLFLSISSNQCGHSPLSATRYFDSKNCCSLDIFLGPVSVILEFVVWENPTVSKILRPVCMAPTTMQHLNLGAI